MPYNYIRKNAIIKNKRKPMDKTSINQKLKTVFWITFIIYFLVLIKLIFFKLPLPAVLMIITGDDINYAHSVNIIPFKTIIFYLHGNPLPHIAFKNLLGNILFFIPFGFLLPVLLSKINSAKNILIASATFSLLLELLQIFLHLGSFDIDDIFLNTVGALIGYLVALKIFTPKKQT